MKQSQEKSVNLLTALHGWNRASKLLELFEPEIMVELIQEFCEFDAHRFDECAIRNTNLR